jgi:hypothetical protein
VGILTLLSSCGGNDEPASGASTAGANASTEAASARNGPVVAPPPAANAPVVALGPAWPSFGRNPQHTAQSAIATQDLNRIAWSTPVDLAPQYGAGGSLAVHYGSPAISEHNTVVVPVKTGATDGFRIEGRDGVTGTLRWTLDTDYALPPHRWTPSYNAVITAGRVAAAAAGGRVLVRHKADSVSSTTRTFTFYGDSEYGAAPATYNANVFINTPITADAQGNLYFGFMVKGATPANLAGGIARIDVNGNGRWVTAAAATGVASITQPAMNSAPALSNDGSTLYVAVNTTRTPGVIQTGYLLALDSTTLATKGMVQLIDPTAGELARVSDDSTASPTVGPDGHVFFGVLEHRSWTHNSRGWMLQFDSTLSHQFVPGSFGWDVTASIVPASMVPSYAGTSTYLIAVKYNNYDGVGNGDGKNRLAILDPASSQTDAITTSVSVMSEVLTALGPTVENAALGTVVEWCVNTMAVDPATHSILANSEDGFLYRWDLTTNTFTQRIRITNGLGEAYTPTAVGPDGAVYAIGNATLFAIRH